MSALKDLESFVLSSNQLNEDGIPSASIAVLDKGEISAHVITSGRENTDTVYQACSISKAITGLAVAKLVDEGSISYDTKVIDYLSDSVIDCIVDNKTSHLLKHVTVAMLLSHSSGLSQHGFPGYANSADLPSEEDILAGRPPSNTPRVRFMTFPGAQFSYSGGGFTVLQLVLEAVTAKPFAVLMQDTLLKPLGMTRSWYGAKPDDEYNYTKAYLTAAVKYPNAVDYHSFVELAAGGLWTTPSDLLKAISAVQKSLHSDTGFIRQDTAKRMLTQISSVSEREGMALGWFVNSTVFAHAGDNWPGYTSYVFGSQGGDDSQMYGKGIAVMANSWVGHERAIKQIVSAIFFLKSWPRFNDLPSHFGKDEYVPYSIKGARMANEEGWREWIGRWGTEWQLLDENGPAWKCKEMDAMEMHPAAAPPQEFDDGTHEFFYVVQGLKLGLRLTWEDGERVVRLLQAEAKTLRRE